MLHLYNLKVEFKTGMKWNLFILAEDITWLPCWYHDRPKDSVVTGVEMKLLKERVERGTGAKGIDEKEVEIYLAK